MKQLEKDKQIHVSVMQVTRKTGLICDSFTYISDDTMFQR